MPQPRGVENLSVEELRQLLIEKQRRQRKSRLEQYQRTGRVMQVAGVDQAPIHHHSEASSQDTTEDKPSRPRRIWLDRLLLGLEILGMLGLIFVLLNGASLLNALNHEVASALQPAALTPTPLIEAVVLPGGHTPPNSPEGARPNDAEIPEHLRAQVQALAAVPVPTSSPQNAQRIRIPAIHVDQTVVQGDSWEDLKRGVGQHVGSADPGEKGNLVLSAHNDIYGETFRYLDKLQPGDEVILSTSQREFVYIIQQVQLVAPTRTDLMSPMREAAVTLISCYPYMVDNQRIVVTAYLQSNP